MAIDKNQIRHLIDEVNALFDSLAGGLPPQTRQWLRDKIIGPAISDIEELIGSARPPVLYLIGRSGHGKSSLINALAGRKIADVGDVRPTTSGSDTYTVVFEESYATWRVIDTRGIFEATSPDGGPAADVIDLLNRDIIQKRPDVILYVIAARELRNLSNDFKAYDSIEQELKRRIGTIPPSLVVLTQADNLGNPRDWFPNASGRKLGLIDDCLSYLARDILDVPDALPIDKIAPYKGLTFDNGPVLCAIPVSSLEGDSWNISTLQTFIGDTLPRSARLDFFQALRNREFLREMARSLTNRFATIAGGIGVSPLPISDIVVLVPLQWILVAIIGGLSCRSLSRDTVVEFLSAIGLTGLSGVGLRLLAQQIAKLLPVPGASQALSGGIAAAGTYGIGRSAEAYFFTGKVVTPSNFSSESPRPS